MYWRNSKKLEIGGDKFSIFLIETASEVVDGCSLRIFLSDQMDYKEAVNLKIKNEVSQNQES